INYRLIKAGKGSVIFEEKARRLIYKMSKGIPRLINLISSRAMMAAYLDMSRSVRKRHIMDATRHALDDMLKGDRHPRFLRKSVAVMLSGALIVAAFMASRNMRAPDIAQKDGNPAAPVKIELESGGIKSGQGTVVGLPGPAEKAAERSPVIVTTQAANLRSGPSLDSETVTSVVRGSVFEVSGEFTEAAGRKWYKVKAADGKECWIAANVVKRIEQGAGPS
ncbi:MAG: SH3 domain-containing protein, partial [Deltaproteobacteria bacterium]|nr:SH3 domain-containing protein [Deltaproteobacteria bacterium]